MRPFGTENYNFIRFFHWVFAFSVALLLLSGFHISQPRVEALWPLNRTRNLHLVLASIFVFSAVGRFYYSVIHRSYHHYLLKPGDFKVFIPYCKYILFINSHPRSLLPRYDLAQKMIFASWLLAGGFQVITGVILLFPEEFRMLAGSLGNLQTFRSVHFYTSLWFLFSVPLHIYFSITEEPVRVQALLLGNGKITHRKGMESLHKRIYSYTRILYNFFDQWIDSTKLRRK